MELLDDMSSARHKPLPGTRAVDFVQQEAAAMLVRSSPFTILPSGSKKQFRNQISSETTRTSSVQSNDTTTVGQSLEAMKGAPSMSGLKFKQRKHHHSTTWLGAKPLTTLTASLKDSGVRWALCTHCLNYLRMWIYGLSGRES